MFKKLQVIHINEKKGFFWLPLTDVSDFVALHSVKHLFNWQHFVCNFCSKHFGVFILFDVFICFLKFWLRVILCFLLPLTSYVSQAICKNHHFQAAHIEEDKSNQSRWMDKDAEKKWQISVFLPGEKFNIKTWMFYSSTGQQLSWIFWMYGCFEQGFPFFFSLSIWWALFFPSTFLCSAGRALSRHNISF